MSVLRPLTSERRRREFSVYDFEWIPGKLEIRLCGSFDGECYTSYTSVDAFIQGELTRENRNRWFFAHSGGRADLLFLLEIIGQHDDWSVDAAMSGSSAIIATVRKHWNSERCRVDGDHSNCPTWTFIDSYWLFRTSLKKIGEKLGMLKGGPDIDEEDDDQKIREWYANVPIGELRDYNEQDCKILWHAIENFQELLWGLGSQLKRTIASCSMELFKRQYLKSDIRIVPGVNEKSYASYAASRVEVFQKEAEMGYSFDINSSFSHAMTFPAPGNAVRARFGKIPEHDLCLAEAEVEVPECYLPPLAYRYGPRLFFPCGRWKSWFTGVDLHLLENQGGKIHWVGECIEFESRDDTQHYAEDIYELRRKAGSDFEKLLFKYLLNALYGKFGEGLEKCALIMNPDEKTLADLRERQAHGLELAHAGRAADISPPEMLFPGAWMDYHEGRITHNHNPLASHITSVARRSIFGFLSEPLKKRSDGPAGEIHYCDTDALSTNLNLWKDSDKLGALKLENSFDANSQDPAIAAKGGAHYYGPKIYQQGDKIRAKGFQLGKTKKTQQHRFREIVEGREIEIERMARLKEMLRAGTFKPYDVHVEKKLQYRAIPKRRDQPDGTTRPWSIEELMKRK